MQSRIGSHCSLVRFLTVGLMTVARSKSHPSCRQFGERTMNKVCLLVAAGCITMTSFAFAQNRNNKQLKGDFPFNETVHIIQQAAVNGACGKTLQGPVTSSIINDTGIISFDGKGNLTSKDSGIFILSNPPTDSTQVEPAVEACSGTYSVSNDNIVDLHYNCSPDGGASYFKVHTKGRFTRTLLLMEASANPDGSQPVNSYIVGNTVVGCSYLAENTVVSLSTD
jgi:hypothetical protein